MSKGGPNHPNPGYFKVAGGRVEERDIAKGSKQALARETARRQQRAGRKTALGQAPAEQRAKEPPKRGARPQAATVKPTAKLNAKVATAAKSPSRKRAKMAAPKDAPRKSAREMSADEESPSRLGNLARRVARAAVAPVAFARAVVGYLRSGRE